ncbi:HSFY1 protein, partial [Oceanites oceanicus]|nr:HSFY1 protein [Oceanites oceanicus]
TSIAFPNKLWKIVQSHPFQSIQWVDDGICVAINQEAFQKEALAQRGPHTVFETDSVKSFLCQLHLYRFTKVQRDSETPDSLDEFLAEDAAAPSAYSKLLFYYDPNFRRDDPHLLKRCKQR